MEDRIIITIDGKKYGVWKSRRDGNDQLFIEAREAVHECPLCGFVTADENALQKQSCKEPSEFVELCDGRIICRECVENDSQFQQCSDGCDVWHVRNDGHGWTDEYKDWHCDECKKDNDEYRREQKQDFLDTVRGE